MPALRRIALVVHPSRDVSDPLSTLRAWSAEHGAEILQVHIREGEPVLAPAGGPDEADLIAALGGDGTVLSALRAGAPSGAPVLGIACGSLGALAAVTPDGLRAALDRFAAGDWDAHELPALHVEPAEEGDEPIDALNDLALVRAGGGQLRTYVALDGVPYAGWTGDGVVLATAVGSSAYTMAAGGPVLAPDTPGSVLTPLSPHGGAIPPLVAGADAVWDVEVRPGHGGVRLEVDGQPSERRLTEFRARLRPGYARLVRLGDEEPFLSALRRRGLIADSPRVVVDRRRATG